MQNRWTPGRIETFSDGVFAIAITLLVLDLGVSQSGFRDLWRAIAEEWPAYLGYATSFITIGWLWMAHHTIFRRLRFANSAAMRLNLVLLMAVAFLPYPTRLMAQAIYSDDAERAAVIFYGAWLLVISFLFWGLWRSIERDRDLLKPDVTERDAKAISSATTPSLGLYVVVIVLAIFAPAVAAFGYLAVAVVAVLRVRGDQPSTDPVGG